MAVQDFIVEAVEYRVALLVSESKRVLALRDIDGFQLPSVEIPRWSRPAEELQRAIKRAWGVYAIVLDFMPSTPGAPLCVAAQVLSVAPEVKLHSIEARALSKRTMPEVQHSALESLMKDQGCTYSPFARIGWIDEAIDWLEGSTGFRLASTDSIDQYNAGERFSLIRFRMENNQTYWMKATGQPNVHELALTVCLSRLGRNHLPEVLATKPDWNAWLASGDAPSFAELSSDPRESFPILATAVRSMARLQIEVQGFGSDLLDAGAFNQGSSVLLAHSEELFEYVAESMALQTSTKAQRLSLARVLELRNSFEWMCLRNDALGVPDSIVHGDMNPGNILVGSDRCMFIDWAEAYVGSAIVGLQNLLLLNRVPDVRAHDEIDKMLIDLYVNEWSAFCDPRILTSALAYMPVFAIASALFGRGDWLSSPLRNDPRRRSYARTLTRCMDRLMSVRNVKEVPCL
jgi:hypothetical protein